MGRRPRSRAVGLVAAILVLAGCGEPAVDVDPPAREPGQHVLDEVGLLEGSDVADRLASLTQAGLDVVAVTYETPQASLGESRRAGQLLIEEWEADIALVAVAVPGDFTSTEVETRSRFFGLESADQFAVPRGLRERIAEERAPALAADNNWPGVFTMAIDEIERELAS